MQVFCFCEVKCRSDTFTNIKSCFPLWSLVTEHYRKERDLRVLLDKTCKFSFIAVLLSPSPYHFSWATVRTQRGIFAKNLQWKLALIKMVSPISSFFMFQSGCWKVPLWNTHLSYSKRYTSCWGLKRQHLSPPWISGPISLYLEGFLGVWCRGMAIL